MVASVRAWLAAALLAFCCHAANGAPPTVEERREEISRLLFGDDQPTHVQAAKNAALALEHLKVLLAGAPGDPHLYFLVGVAQAAIAEEHGIESAPRESVEAAIAAFEKARRLGPDGALAEDAAGHLGILYSLLGQFERALGEYDRALRLRAASRLAVGPDDQSATEYGNAAESLMALGRLDEAIARYRTSLELAESPKTRTLALYGLAVALDRDEQIEKSGEALRQALALEQQQILKPLAALEDPEVFFMPRGEKSYYQALGYLATGRESAAAASLRIFLGDLPRSPWAGRARAHLQELEALLRDGAGRFHIAFGAVRSPPRDDGAIARMLQRSEARLKGCFAREAFLDGGARGALVLLVRTDGRVEHVAGVAGALVFDGPCAEAVVRSWRFGAGTGGLLEVPLELEVR